MGVLDSLGMKVRGDGHRVLIDQVWPRGVSRGCARFVAGHTEHNNAVVPAELRAP